MFARLSRAEAGRRRRACSLIYSTPSRGKTRPSRLLRYFEQSRQKLCNVFLPYASIDCLLFVKNKSLSARNTNPPRLNDSQSRCKPKPCTPGKRRGSEDSVGLAARPNLAPNKATTRGISRAPTPTLSLPPSASFVCRPLPGRDWGEAPAAFAGRAGPEPGGPAWECAPSRRRGFLQTQRAGRGSGGRCRPDTCSRREPGPAGARRARADPAAAEPRAGAGRRGSV